MTDTDATTTESSSFGSRARSRMVLMYAGTVVPTVVVIYVVLRMGSGLRAPEASGSPSEATAGNEAVDTHEVLWKILLAVVVIIVLSRIVGTVFRRINQPQVMGEIVAGVMLGPSLLGNVWPEASSFLFDEHVLPFIDVMAQIGLVLFMFLIGVELDVRLIRGRGQAAAVVSHVSIVVPFVSGVLLALGIFSQLGSAEGDFLPFALFLGASMSITAFPVLARILAERNLNKSRLGAVTLTCAAIGDLTAWCILAVVLAVSADTGTASAALTILVSLAYIGFMLTVVRRFLQRLAAYHEARGQITGTMLTLLLAGLLLSALATDRIGIHAIFGAFVFGAIMPHRSEFIYELMTKLEDFAVVFLLPLFFAFSGLRTEIGTLGADAGLWLICGLIVFVAVIAKWGASTLAARFVGLGWREANGLGVLMNCRGLTELVILNIGLDLGVIPPTLFAMLVIMALVTTFMTTPALAALYPAGTTDSPLKAPEDEREEAEAAEQKEKVWRAVVHISNIEKGYELLHTALSLAESQQQPTQVLLVRTLDLPDGLFRGAVEDDGSRVQRALAGMRPLVEFVEGAGVDAVPVVVSGRSLDDSLIRVVDERKPDLVLLSWRRPLIGSGLLDGSVGEVLRRADADVALLVDPTDRGTILPAGGEVLVPYGAAYHEETALELGLRLARTHGAGVRLLGPTDNGDSHALASAAAKAYEDSGVWTVPEPVSGDAVEAALRRAHAADIVILGVGDIWAHDPSTLGHRREHLASRSATPLLIVRRAGQQLRRGPRRWWSRPAEWMEHHDGDEGARADEPMLAR